MTRGHFAGLQFVQAARVLPVLVAEGQVVEQVFGGLDVLGGKHLRHAWADAAHIHDWSIEGWHVSMLQPGGRGSESASRAGQARTEVVFFDHGGSASRQAGDGIHRSQTRRKFRAASKARPIACRFCRRRAGEKSAVFLPGQFHPANRAAIYAGRRNPKRNGRRSEHRVPAWRHSTLCHPRAIRHFCFPDAHLHPSILAMFGKNSGCFRTWIK